MAGRLQKWQAAKDELLWKFILSLEFGERADLPRLTRDLMRRIEQDLGKDLVRGRRSGVRRGHIATLLGRELTIYSSLLDGALM